MSYKCKKTSGSLVMRTGVFNLVYCQLKQRRCWSCDWDRESFQRSLRHLPTADGVGHPGRVPGCWNSSLVRFSGLCLRARSSRDRRYSAAVGLRQCRAHLRRRHHADDRSESRRVLSAWLAGVSCSRAVVNQRHEHQLIGPERFKPKTSTIETCCQRIHPAR